MNEKNKNIAKTIIYFTIPVVGGLLIIFLTALFIRNQNNANSNEPGPKHSQNIELKITNVKPDNDSINSGGVAKPEVVNGKIHFTTAGSSTCPPTLDKAYYDSDKDRYVLHIQQYSKRACTMDMRPFAQVVERTDNRGIPTDARIVVEK